MQRSRLRISGGPHCENSKYICCTCNLGTTVGNKAMDEHNFMHIARKESFLENVPARLINEVDVDEVVVSAGTAYCSCSRTYFSFFLFECAR